MFHSIVVMHIKAECYTAASRCTLYSKLALTLLSIPVQLWRCIKIHTSKIFLSILFEQYMFELKTELVLTTIWIISYMCFVYMYLFQYLPNLLSCLQLQQLIADMKEIYARARICPHSINSINYNYRQSGSCDLALDPGKTSHMFSQLIIKANHYIRCFYIWLGAQFFIITVQL
jgi:hypothetical protein